MKQKIENATANTLFICLLGWPMAFYLLNI